jgi:hypothetical protein
MAEQEPRIYNRACSGNRSGWFQQASSTDVNLVLAILHIGTGIGSVLGDLKHVGVVGTYLLL